MAILSVGALFIYLIPDALNIEGITKLYTKIPAIFWAAGVCSITWVILTLLSRIKSKSALGTDNTENALLQLDRVVSDSNKELGVPEKHVLVDVLAFLYKTENGKHIPTLTFSHPYYYSNNEMNAYIKDNSLFLSDARNAYAFPLADLRRIVTVNDNICTPQWNKKIKYDEGIYEQYNMTMDQNSTIHISPYYILEVEHNGELFGIYFPCYELPTFEELTKLHCETKE